MINFDVKDYHKTYEENFSILSTNVYRFVGSLELDAPYFIIRKAGTKEGAITLLGVDKNQLAKDHVFVKWFMEQDVGSLKKDLDKYGSFSEVVVLGQWDGTHFIATDVETSNRLGVDVEREFKTENFYYVWEFLQFGMDVDFNEESTFDVLQAVTDFACNQNPYAKILYNNWDNPPIKGIVWRRSMERNGTKYWFRTEKSTLDLAVESAILELPNTSWDVEKKVEYALENFILPTHIDAGEFEKLLREELTS